MSSNLTKLKRKVIASLLLSSLLIQHSSAILKEITVYGARSINYEGKSDMVTSMEMLEEDYSSFKNENGLIEYFWRNTENPNKADLSEAFSWLIDNNIISRDMFIRISAEGVDRLTVNIDKTSMNYMYRYVNRSDLIMYLYKAVFGPIWARSVGIELPNYRVDNGKQLQLSQIIINNHGTSEEKGEYKLLDVTEQTQEQGVGVSTSKTNSNRVGYYVVKNDLNNWRYTPQGDKYSSIFGDTNIFISQTDITQESSIIVDGEESSVSGNSNGSGYQYNGLDNSDTNSNEMNFYNDYKNIYFSTGADIWFYRTHDVVEEYIRAALSKGILDIDTDLRSADFYNVFLSNSKQTPYWSGDAVPVVYNRRFTKQTRQDTAQPVPKNGSPLGVNYSVYSIGNTLSIQRVNPFMSQSGYFNSEIITKMDVYRYIYKFIYANEKKMSNLERDIINYKYGMDIESTTLSQEDADIIKYLIAVGIINYDNPDDLSRIYKPVIWMDFLELLYRVAKPDARLDFSKVQLTDSETSWQAKGYLEKSITIVPESKYGVIRHNADIPEEYLPKSRYDTDVTASAPITKTQSNDVELHPVTLSDLDLLTSDGQVNMFAATENTVTLNHKANETLVGYYDFSADLLGIYYAYYIGFLSSPNLKKDLKTYFDAIKDVYNSGSISNEKYIDQCFQQLTPDVNDPNKTVWRIIPEVDSTELSSLSKEDKAILAANLLSNILIHNLYSVMTFRNSKIARDAVKELFKDYKDSTNFGTLVENTIEPAFEQILENIKYEDRVNGTTIDKEFKPNNPTMNLSWYLSSGSALNSAGYAALHDLRSKSSANDLKYNSLIEGHYIDNATVTQYSFNRLQFMQSYIPVNKNYTDSFKELKDTVISIIFKNRVTGTDLLTRDIYIYRNGYSDNNISFKTVVEKFLTTVDDNGPKPSLKRSMLNQVTISMTFDYSGIPDINTKEDAAKYLSTFITTTTSYNNQQLSTISVGSTGNLIISDPDQTQSNSTQQGNSNSQGSTTTTTSQQDDTQIKAFVDPTGTSAFVEWSEVAKLSNISKESDLLLVNNDTDTRAYFSSGTDMKVALVGTEIIPGDETLGVVFSSGEGEGKKYYYHFNAIKALISAKDESTVLNAIPTIEKADPKFTDKLQTVDIISDKGYIHSGVYGIMSDINATFTTTSTSTTSVRTEKQLTQTKPNATVDELKDAYNFMDNWAAGASNFLIASSSNRVMNYVTKRIVYDNNGTKEGIYAVLIFEPCDPTDMDGAVINSSMSVQDILDAAVEPPSSLAGKKIYNANKSNANAYANWIYGTRGKTYIGTGYVVPRLFLFYPEEQGNNLPASMMKGLSKVQKESILEFPLIEFPDGKVDKPELSTVTLQNPTDVPYSVSKNGMVLVYCDRVYLNDNLFSKHMKRHTPTSTQTVSPNYAAASTGNRLTYLTINEYQSDAVFHVGDIFNIHQITTQDGNPYPQNLIVTEISSSGKITALYGPLEGYPVIVNTGTAANGYARTTHLVSTRIMNKLNSFNSSKPFNVSELLSLDDIQNQSINQSTTPKPLSYASKANYLDELKEKLQAQGFKVTGFGYPAIEPSFSKLDGVYGKYNGRYIVYQLSERQQSNAVNVVSAKSGNTYKNWLSNIDSAYYRAKGNSNVSTTGLPSVYSYLQLTFDGYLFSKDQSGILTKSSVFPNTFDYINPALTSSLNDLIVDEMIFASGSALPVSRLPSGSLLNINDIYFYQSANYNKTREYIGFVPLNGAPSAQSQGYSLSDVYPMFSGSFIRIGSIFTSVTRFFDSASICTTLDSDVMNAIELGKQVWADSNTVNVVTTNGGKLWISQEVKPATSTPSNNIYYLPVKIALNDLLYAKKEPSNDDTSPAIYRNLSFAKNTAIGAFTKLPFWIDDIMTAEIAEPTTTLTPGLFKLAEGIEAIKNSFNESFNSAQQGDLLTLLRFILFWITVWLAMAGWICLIFKKGRLEPILEVFNSPSINSKGSGIDLLAVISLGTIRNNTEFTISRFLLYELMLAGVMLLLWKLPFWNFTF